MTNEEIMEKYWGPNAFILLCAFRYCLCRTSYAPSMIIMLLEEHWEFFHPETKKLMHKEIKEAFVEENCVEEWAKVLEWKVDEDEFLKKKKNIIEKF